MVIFDFTPFHIPKSYKLPLKSNYQSGKLLFWYLLVRINECLQNTFRNPVMRAGAIPKIWREVTCLHWIASNIRNMVDPKECYTHNLCQKSIKEGDWGPSAKQKIMRVFVHFTALKRTEGWVRASLSYILLNPFILIAPLFLVLRQIRGTLLRPFTKSLLWKVKFIWIFQIWCCIKSMLVKTKTCQRKFTR